jgi:hypothetical protein
LNNDKETAMTDPIDTATEAATIAEAQDQVDQEITAEDTAEAGE